MALPILFVLHYNMWSLDWTGVESNGRKATHHELEIHQKKSHNLNVYDAFERKKGPRQERNAQH